MFKSSVAIHTLTLAFINFGVKAILYHKITQQIIKIYDSLLSYKKGKPFEYLLFLGF